MPGALLRRMQLCKLMQCTQDSYLLILPSLTGSQADRRDNFMTTELTKTLGLERWPHVFQTCPREQELGPISQDYVVAKDQRVLQKLQICPKMQSHGYEWKDNSS